LSFRILQYNELNTGISKAETLLILAFVVSSTFIPKQNTYKLSNHG